MLNQIDLFEFEDGHILFSNEYDLKTYSILTTNSELNVI